MQKSFGSKVCVFYFGVRVTRNEQKGVAQASERFTRLLKGVLGGSAQGDTLLNVQRTH